MTVVREWSITVLFTMLTSGCFSCALKSKYRATEPSIIVELLMAIASRVDMPNKEIAIGIMMPPPPIPPMLDKASRTIRMKIPIHSMVKRGNSYLCRHIPSTHYLKAPSEHSWCSLHTSPSVFGLKWCSPYGSSYPALTMIRKLKIKSNCFII